MGSKDEAKGRVKKAAGSLADDEDLEREGRIDQAVGDVKDAIDGAAEKVKDVANPSSDPDESNHS